MFVQIAFLSLITPFCAPQFVELINPISTSQIQCIVNQRNCPRNASFWIRIGKFDGSIDQVGIQNFKNVDRRN